MLRSLSLFVFFALLSATSSAQQFQNGDFETLIDCPGGFDFDLAITTTLDHWVSVQGTSDGWHEECPAIAASTNGAVPDPIGGNGYGGFFMNEAMSQELTSPLQAGTTYCVSFDGYLASIVGNFPDDLSCFQLCLYGSNTAHPGAGGFDIPVAVEDMDDTALLGCSEEFNDSEEWGSFEISFEADANYAHIIVTGFQEGECMLASPYICFDNIAFVNCEVNNIAEKPAELISVYPNPTSASAAWRIQFEQLPTEGDLALYSATGQLLMNVKLNSQAALDIPTTNLNAGSYFLVCTLPSGTETKVLIVE